MAIRGSREYAQNDVVPIIADLRIAILAYRALEPSIAFKDVELAERLRDALNRVQIGLLSVVPITQVVDGLYLSIIH
jgi:hypothetical protein